PSGPLCCRLQLTLYTQADVQNHTVSSGTDSVFKSFLDLLEGIYCFDQLIQLETPVTYQLHCPVEVIFLRADRAYQVDFAVVDLVEVDLGFVSHGTMIRSIQHYRSSLPADFD